MTLNRNVTGFFPEVEQVAFCTQNMVPGIEHSNDPLLQGRAFSYFDTQITRLGGPNFNQIPINRPIGCPFFNHQRDGMHRMPITSGLNYWPNRNGTVHPIAEKHGGYTVHKAPVIGTKERARGPKFDDHFSQATLFYNSLNKVEKQHTISAYSFELGKVDDHGIRQRMINNLNHVANDLACAVAVNIDVDPPEPLPPNINSSKRSDYISQIDGKNQTYTATGRKVGIFILDGFDAVFVETLMTILTAAGCVPMVVGPRKGIVKAGTTGAPNLNTQFSFETCRSTHFDAVYFAGGKGEEYMEAMEKSGRLIHAAREAYSHFKTVGASGSAVRWLEICALPRIFAPRGEEDEDKVVVLPGVVRATSISVGHDFAKQFLQEVAKHRAWDRDVSMVAA
jgi:catalase